MPRSEWMWSEAFGLLEQAERLHRQFFRLAVTTRPEAVWEPPVDVFEDDAEVLVVVAMPGVAADRVEVIREAGGALVVRGERRLPIAGTRHVIRHLEIPYGRFERRIALPADLAIEATELTHGVLVVRLARARDPRTKRP